MKTVQVHLIIWTTALFLIHVNVKGWYVDIHYSSDVLQLLFHQMSKEAFLSTTFHRNNVGCNSLGAVIDMSHDGKLSKDLQSPNTLHSLLIRSYIIRSPPFSLHS